MIDEATRKARAVEATRRYRAKNPDKYQEIAKRWNDKSKSERKEYWHTVGKQKRIERIIAEVNA